MKFSAALSALALSGASATLTYKDIDPPVQMITIPTGWYSIGTNTTTPPYFDQGPEHDVFVDAFAMAAYEITNAQFVNYLNLALADGLLYHHVVTPDEEQYGKVMPGAEVVMSADPDLHEGERIQVFGGPSDDEVNPINGCQIEWDDDNEQFKIKDADPTYGSFEDWPAVYITWYGADSFAKYYNGSLATEAQWEVAAQAGDKDLDYSTADGKISEEQVNYNWYVNYTTPVGSYDPNPLGFYDMSGNAFEWLADWYGDYNTTDNVNPTGVWGEVPLHNSTGNPSGFNCSGTDPGASCTKCIRGGSYNYMEPFQATTSRNKILPFLSTDHIAGVRFVVEDAL